MSVISRVPEERSQTLPRIAPRAARRRHGTPLITASQQALQRFNIFPTPSRFYLRKFSAASPKYTAEYPDLHLTPRQRPAMPLSFLEVPFRYGTEKHRIHIPIFSPKIRSTPAQKLRHYHRISPANIASVFPKYPRKNEKISANFLLSSSQKIGSFPAAVTKILPHRFDTAPENVPAPSPQKFRKNLPTP